MRRAFIKRISKRRVRRERMEKQTIKLRKGARRIKIKAAAEGCDMMSSNEITADQP